MNHQNKEISDLIYKDKYLQEGETFKEGMSRIAGALSDNQEEFYRFRDVLLKRRFLPAGRIQSSVGAARITTPFNCYVSTTIEDSMEGITNAAKEAMETLKLGGGIGYDFSTLRPSGARISSLDSTSCGPVGNGIGDTRGFMDWFDAGCAVIRSAGHRRGAQMGVLRVDHPDIRQFISAKREAGRLTNFNVSVAITDKFMDCVKTGEKFPLVFKDRVYEWVDARNLWMEIMQSTWDYAEPGVLFIDRINTKNNLWYCETIAATNPCGEQPLPPNGACLLGSFNLVNYIERDDLFNYSFNVGQFLQDINVVVPAVDRIIDTAVYPLPEQEKEAKAKRRMGLGVTGLADAAHILGHRYGSEDMKFFTKEVMRMLRDTAYLVSCRLAAERGSFEMFDKEKYLQSNFVKTLPKYVQESIAELGIRNSHLLSVAPTGTISLAAGNVSSGIEPPYNTGLYNRKVRLGTGEVRSFTIADYVTANFPDLPPPVSAVECSVEDHVDILNIVSNYVDSSVSKTCNVGDHVTFQEFCDVYMRAYEGGASGCTTFREAGFREGVITSMDTEKELPEGSACFIDPETGQRTCE